MSASITALLWFLAIVALIPLALWLLKRSPMGQASQASLMRHVATLPLGPNQRVVTIEVGTGEARQWLVLGVTPQGMTALHTMPPQGEPPLAGVPSPPFADLLQRLRQGADRGR